MVCLIGLPKVCIKGMGKYPASLGLHMVDLGPFLGLNPFLSNTTTYQAKKPEADSDKKLDKFGRIWKIKRKP